MKRIKNNIDLNEAILKIEELIAKWSLYIEKELISLKRITRNLTENDQFVMKKVLLDVETKKIIEDIFPLKSYSSRIFITPQVIPTTNRVNTFRYIVENQVREIIKVRDMLEKDRIEAEKAVYNMEINIAQQNENKKEVISELNKIKKRIEQSQEGIDEIWAEMRIRDLTIIHIKRLWELGLTIPHIINCLK